MTAWPISAGHHGIGTDAKAARPCPLTILTSNRVHARQSGDTSECRGRGTQSHLGWGQCVDSRDELVVEARIPFFLRPDSPVVQHLAPGIAIPEICVRSRRVCECDDRGGARIFWTSRRRSRGRTSCTDFVYDPGNFPSLRPVERRAPVQACAGLTGPAR